MVFNSIIAEISIPYSHSNFNDQRQWYYLKNSKEENVITVLTSFFCDFSTLDTSSNLNITKNYNSSKGEISYEAGANNQYLSILNCTTTEHKANMTYTNINYGYHNFKSGFSDIDNDNDINNTLKNNDLIIPPNNNSNNNHPHHHAIFSPFSDRNQSNNILNDNIININNSNNDNIISILQEYLDNNQGECDKELNERIKKKVALLIEKEERIKQQQIKNAQALERIREKENQLNKDKELLEEKIRKFKHTQSEFEKKSMSLAQSSLLFEKDLANYIIEREIYENCKENFFTLNYTLSTNQNIPITTLMNDLTSSFNHLSKNVKIDMKKFNMKKENKKKEVVVENVNKYIAIKPKRDSQSSSSSSNKISKQLNNTGIGLGLSSNVVNLNTTTINVSDININASNNETRNLTSKKVSPPIAQINLNYYDYQTPKNEVFIENKLLDSLECNFQPAGNKQKCDGSSNGNSNSNDVKLKKRNEINSNNDNNTNSNNHNIMKTKVKNNSNNGLQQYNQINNNSNNGNGYTKQQQLKGNVISGKSIDKNINTTNNCNPNNINSINNISNNTIQQQIVSSKREAMNKNDIGGNTFIHKFKKNNKGKI